MSVRWLDAKALAGDAAFDGTVALVADLEDPQLTTFCRLELTDDDRADERRPGATRRTYFGKRRALTRWVIARHLGCAPELVRVRYDADGAPAFVAPDGAGFVSVAGRDRFAAVAVAKSPAGIDLETLTETTPVDAVLHPDERRRLATSNDPSRDFLRIWVAKEATLKALGTGFKREPTTVSITWDNCETFQVVLEPDPLTSDQAVMAGLVPAIHANPPNAQEMARRTTWMPGTRPGMTMPLRLHAGSFRPTDAKLVAACVVLSGS